MKRRCRAYKPFPLPPLMLHNATVRNATLQVKEYRRYVMREVMHHGGLKHPFIIDLKAS